MMKGYILETDSSGDDSEAPNASQAPDVIAEWWRIYFPDSEVDSVAIHGLRRMLATAADRPSQAERCPAVLTEPFTINVTMNVLEPLPVWVVKTKEGRYARGIGGAAGGFLAVKSPRMATRFDSPTWAATIATMFEGSVVRRLITKTEKEAREARKAKVQTWVWPGPSKIVGVATESESSPSSRKENEGT
jgi:hypothetical protein